jgi:FkbM family methyltransferase
MNAHAEPAADSRGRFELLRAAIGVRTLPLVRAYVRYSPWSIGKRFLYDQFGWRQRTFRARTRFGGRLDGNTTELVQRSIYWFGTWEPNLTAWVRQRLAPGDTFLDIGANLGYYTLLASGLVGSRGRVVAMEPSPSIFELLKQTVSVNGLTNVVAMNVAAGAAKGNASIFRGPEDQLGWSSLLPEWMDGLSLEGTTDVVALDDVVPPEIRRQIRIAKIDVEGFEMEVIAGAHGVIADADRAEFVVEVNATTYQTVAAAFENAGFHPYLLANSYNPVDYINPDVSKAVRFKSGALPERGDVIFSRRDVSEL